MVCYHPITAWRSKDKNDSGKRGIVFNRNAGFADLELKIPCGQCIGCRLERSRQWAMRCVHEASLYDRNCFITLTFNDDYLPENRSLDVRDFQLFMKRLRKRFGSDIRFYHCGEYGEKYGRPHYHACLFNFDFADKKLWRVNNGQPLYISDDLQSLWPYGYAVIGEVTFESAAYVARYIMKKITGEQAQEHYEYVVPDTGEVIDRKPEYTTMSRRPGIGKGWFDKFKDDCYPKDYITINGVKMRPPKYYDTQFEAEFPSDFNKLKRLRLLNSKKFIDNNSSERLNVRERVKLAQLNMLVRDVVD